MKNKPFIRDIDISDIPNLLVEDWDGPMSPPAACACSAEEVYAGDAVDVPECEQCGWMGHSEKFCPYAAVDVPNFLVEDWDGPLSPPDPPCRVCGTELGNNDDFDQCRACSLEQGRALELEQAELYAVARKRAIAAVARRRLEVAIERAPLATIIRCLRILWLSVFAPSAPRSFRGLNRR